MLSDAEFSKRMVTRLCKLETEESMVTITPGMAAHIHAMHVKKEISRKLTGDRTKILMLTFPFICRDLPYNEVWSIAFISHNSTQFHIYVMKVIGCQVAFLNREIQKFPAGHPLRQHPTIVDPSNEIHFKL